MDIGAWQATDHMVPRVRNYLVTKQQLVLLENGSQVKNTARAGMEESRATPLSESWPEQRGGWREQVPQSLWAVN